MKLKVSNFLPIPPILLATWQLPPGWGDVVLLSVAGSDYQMGKGTPVVATVRSREWQFTAPVGWVPMDYRGSEVHFCALSLTDFRTILIDKITGVTA